MAGPVEELLSLNEEILEIKADLRRETLSRRAILAGLIVAPLGLLTLILVTYFTWREFDMSFWNSVFGILFIIIFATSAWFAGEQSDELRPANLRLQLALLNERKRLRASELVVSREYRRSSYREDVPEAIGGLRRESKYYRRIHNGLQSIIIIGSLTTSTVTGIALDNSPLQWFAVGASFSVGIAAGFTGYFKFRERSFYLQQTADAIEQELSAVDLGIGRYSEQTEDRALGNFVAEVERLRSEQRKREHSLDQPPERSASSPSSG